MSITDDSTRTAPASRSSRCRRSAASSPQRRPPNAARSTSARHRGAMASASAYTSSIPTTVRSGLGSRPAPLTRQGFRRISSSSTAVPRTARSSRYVFATVTAPTPASRRLARHDRTRAGVNAVRCSRPDLGDAGEALDVAHGIDASALSAERQARLLVDVARAHAQRRHAGEAVAALLDAERLAPEQVRSHHLARAALADLIDQFGRRPPDQLLALASRCGSTPAR